eukprot:g6751.t1
MAYCSKCKKSHMKRLERKRWAHRDCGIYDSRKRIPKNRRNNSTKKKVHHHETTKKKVHHHKTTKKKVHHHKTTKKKVHHHKTQTVVKKNQNETEKKVQLVEREARRLESEERFDEALRKYLCAAEMMISNKKDPKLVSKLDRILSRAENLKRPIYVRLSSKEKVRLIRNEGKWTYRKGKNWRKLGNRSVVVDDQDHMYGRGQNAANDAFETLRRGRRKEKVIVRQYNKKSSNLRIASWNVKFLTATSHHVGDTLRIERRLKRIAITILSNHFDVIVIQEVCSGGGGRKALKMLCEKFLKSEWTFRVWPDRRQGRVRDDNNVSGARNEMYAILWKEHRVVVNADLIPRERESDWTLSPNGNIVKASSTGDYDLNSFTKIGLFRVDNTLIATTHASIWSPHSDKKQWARFEVKRLMSICEQAEKNGLRFVLMGDFNIEMNKFKSLRFYKDMMLLDTHLDTMTNGKSHNDNAFVTSNVKIVHSGIVPVPKAHKHWVMMELASLSEYKKRNTMTRRARSQFESRIWSDHRPIYIDIA